jgi:hypothetical protein
MRHSWILTLIGLGTLAFAVDRFSGARPVAENEVPLIFSGGHEIAKGDWKRSPDGARGTPLWSAGACSRSDSRS